MDVLHRCICLCLLVLPAFAPCDAAEKELPRFPRPPGPHFPLAPEAHDGAASFKHGQPVVGATYFYWYNAGTGAHVMDADFTDALTTHPADMDNLNYREPSWHKAQLEDMIDAGIDFLMPVYWGVPGHYETWTFHGLPPLVKAHDALLEEERTPPAIGLFYDTTILKVNAYNADGTHYHVDLATDFGRRWFYTAMRDFFSIIPPDKWARVDGRPAVFLYAGQFARRQAEDQFEPVYRWFEEDFGCKPFLVKMRDWRGAADATYQWGGAINPQLDEHVAALGPGYDHSAVPGRKPVVVDRKDGRTYAQRWLSLLRLHPAHRPWMVHVETWNEWHEGTDIAHSREYGRSYLVLTRMFADMWRVGEHLSPVGRYVKADAVSWAGGKARGIDTFENPGDGLYELVPLEPPENGEPFTAVRTRPSEIAPDSPYLYFDVDDGFGATVEWDTLMLSVTYRDAGCETMTVEYDSANLGSSVRDGAFRYAGKTELGGTGAWKTGLFELTECWFANRANGADFRFSVRGGDLRFTVREVVLRRTQPQ